jgi:dTDP-4-dehydrorhamnose reductase
MQAERTDAPGGSVEIWGGVECTVNRVGERYFDQLAKCGHASRIEDLDAIAGLGIRVLRYPVLWELHAPDEHGIPDWTWADARLARLRELGIEPIVGFVHHGSGPRHTNLLDDGFATGLARYARQFAERYPWVRRYTPVNEPLTTARFSALYGHWYPHRTDDRSFSRAVLNQCRAIRVAMDAVRRVSPHAELVQTDDLGRTSSTLPLRYQAEFDNHRRWLAWDLLAGRVTRAHALRPYLLEHGVEDAELDSFLEAPCAPDIVGVNHYLTSNRFLHHELDRFPAHLRGGNGRDRYADVEAVRVSAAANVSLGELLREASQRYDKPVAVTEAHLGCTREEQLRWLHDTLGEANAARASGVDVRAVTVWALLGSYDWNSLVTRETGHYEPGAFDVRGGHPRPTALARLIKAVSAEQPLGEPLVEQPGWWKRPGRSLDAASSDRLDGGDEPGERASRARLLICGATGTLGRAFARVCEERGLSYRSATRAELDICTESDVGRMLDEVRPWAVINAAGFVRVDDAEREADRCRRENTVGPTLLATACAARSVPFLTFSSDLVFDGERALPYTESAPVAPLNVYGSSKAAAERAVLEAYREALVVRTSAFFGPWDPHNFVTRALAYLEAARPFAAIDDLTVSPTYVPDLVNACLDLLLDRERGLWHLANSGSTTWAELAELAAAASAISAARLRRVGWRDAGLAAHRPRYSVLGSERGLLLPALDDAVARFAAARARKSLRAAQESLRRG